MSRHIGLKIKELRKKFGYYQEDLAIKLNEHFQIYKIEKNLTKNVIFRQVDISNMENKPINGSSNFKTMFLITFFYEKHDVSPEFFFLNNKLKPNKNNDKFLNYINNKFNIFDKQIDKLKAELKNDVILYIKRNH